MNSEEEGRRLASQRDDLIAQGVDPGLLEVPLAGTAPTSPAVPDDTTDPTWLDEAVEAGARAVPAHFGLDDWDHLGEALKATMREQAHVTLLAALPVLMGAAAASGEGPALARGDGDWLDGACDALEFVRNFGSEVGRA